MQAFLAVHRRHTSRSTRVASFASLLCTAGLLVAVPSAAAWSVSPALLNSSLSPGKVTRGTFTVKTTDAKGRAFRVVLQNLAEAAQGAFTFPRASRAAHSAARWIAIEPAKFTATGGPQPVDYAISVPANASPGDHVAAISVQELPVSSAGNIGVVDAIGLRETVRVPGPALTAARIVRFDAPRVSFGGSVPLTATVENTGDTVLNFAGGNAASLSAGNARVRFTGVLLPGAQRTISTRWRDPPTIGNSSERVTVDLGNGRSASVARATLVLPVWALVLAGAAVALSVALVWRTRRRGRAAHSHATSET
jgi:hypothetical protein